MNIIIAPSYSQNLPKQLGAVAWYDACRPGALESGNKVSSWTDLTGNGWHATQPTDSARPVWADSTQRGRPVVSFTNSCNVNTASLASIASNKVTWMCVHQSTTHTADRYAFVFQPTSSNHLLLQTYFASGVFSGKAGAMAVFQGGVNPNLCTIAATTSPVIYAATVDTSLTTNEETLYKNGSTTGITRETGYNLNSTMTYPASILTLGCSSLIGWIAEFMFFNRVLSAGELSRMHQYLSQKWGIKRA